jgi:hypothetical protein
MIYRTGTYRITGPRWWRMLTAGALIMAVMVASPIIYVAYALLGVIQMGLTLYWLFDRVITENWDEKTDR